MEMSSERDDHIEISEKIGWLTTGCVNGRFFPVFVIESEKLRSTPSLLPSLTLEHPDS